MGLSFYDTKSHRLCEWVLAAVSESEMVRSKSESPNPNQPIHFCGILRSQTDIGRAPATLKFRWPFPLPPHLYHQQQPLTLSKCSIYEAPVIFSSVIFTSSQHKLLAEATLPMPKSLPEFERNAPPLMVFEWKRFIGL